MAISIDDIKKLKELTGVGLTDAKTALVEADGDFDKALEAMRKKGLTKAEKKADREALEGVPRADGEGGGGLPRSGDPPARPARRHHRRRADPERGLCGRQGPRL